MTYFYYQFFYKVFKSNKKLPLPFYSEVPNSEIYGEFVFLENQSFFTKCKQEIIIQISRCLYKTANGYIIDKTHTIFYISEQSSTIYIYSKDTMENVTLSIMGDVLALFFRLRQRYQLHACMLHLNGNTFVLCGSSGSGKSTLAYECLGLGGRVLCDDHSIVYYEGDILLGIPSFPYLKIFSTEYTGLAKNVCFPIADKKYLVAVEENHINDFFDKEYPISNIVFLEQNKHQDFVSKISPLSPADILVRLIKNTYANLRSNGDISLLKKDIQYLSTLKKISNTIPCYFYQYSFDNTPNKTLTYLVDFLNRQIDKKQTTKFKGGFYEKTNIR